MTLLQWLIQHNPGVSRTTLRAMIGRGRVSVNGQIVRRAAHEVGAEDQIRVSARQRAAAETVDARSSIGPLKIVYEDADVLVVIKPAGLLTSTVPRERRPTAIALVRRYLAQSQPSARAGVVHRLDRDASGLLVFSKNHAAHQHLKRQFFRHTVRRTYSAIVHGVPEPRSGRIESRLSEAPDGSVRSTRRPGRGRTAVTRYQVLAVLAGGRSLLSVTLETGRKHQIRAHLAERGHPVVNDTVYGSGSPKTGRLMLAATGLAFEHPRTGRPMEFQIPPPPEMQSMIAASTPTAGPQHRSEPA
jgi:23S rRNA pseudouridine1911/1915/1917 synthase